MPCSIIIEAFVADTVGCSIYLQLHSLSLPSCTDGDGIYHHHVFCNSYVNALENGGVVWLCVELLDSVVVRWIERNCSRT